MSSLIKFIIIDHKHCFCEYGLRASKWTDPLKTTTKAFSSNVLFSSMAASLTNYVGNVWKLLN